VNKEGINIGEEENMCCYCIEIKMGVGIIGVMQILTALMNVSLASSGWYWAYYTEN